MLRCCELLSISYLCIMIYNFWELACCLALVVNCFQFRIFALWFTMFLTSWYISLSLWIAFNFVSLHYDLQFKRRVHFWLMGCELLSISYLCIMIYNFNPAACKRCIVVNCFQFRIFALWFTIIFDWWTIYSSLWIAFNFVSLHYDLQLPIINETAYSCCELLSISYLCIMIYNTPEIIAATTAVVNCFQFRIFALWFTMKEKTWNAWSWLWIAFNFVSLHYDLQSKYIFKGNNACCELLSISYLCIMIYN